MDDNTFLNNYCIGNSTSSEMWSIGAFATNVDPDSIEFALMTIDNNYYETYSTTAWLYDTTAAATTIAAWFADTCADGSDREAESCLAGNTGGAWRIKYGGEPVDSFTVSHNYYPIGVTEEINPPCIPGTFATLLMADDSLMSLAAWEEGDTLCSSTISNTFQIREGTDLLEYIDYRIESDSLHIEKKSYWPSGGFGGGW